MFVAVLGVLDNFKTIWQAVVAFASARAALAAAIADIRAEELKQSGTTTGITENKRLARQAMCSAAAIVGGAVAQWAETQGKNDTFDAVDFSAPDLLHQTEADCLTNCTAIYNAGNANIAALTTAGTLAAADLTDLNTKIGAFNTLIAAPRLTSIVWTRNCSALEIFALNGVALKSASTRTMFARSSAMMGLA